jgi:tRNA1(Val) A37 N6-methylase TrmN6
LKPKQKVAELGAGVGALSLVLAEREEVEVVGFEIQPELVEAARRNAESNAGRLKGRVEFEQFDIRRVGGTKWERRFDRVVANPPFFKAGQGRRSPSGARDLARRESSATLEDFVRAAAILLRSRGRFQCIFRPERLEELLALMSRHRCPAKLLRPIYSRPDREAEWVIVTGVKDAREGLKIAPPRQV